MKKLFLYIFLILWCCNFANNANAVVKKHAGTGELHLSEKIIDEMKDILLQRITNRKNRVAATDEFVLKERDYTKDDGIMIGVW